MTAHGNPVVLPAWRKTAMADTPSLYDRQHELETEMSALGTRRFREAIKEAREAEREASTQYGNKLIAVSVVLVSDAIKEMIKQANMQPTRAPRAARYLRLLDFDTSAFLALKGVINGISMRRRLQGVAVKIGRAVEDEVRFQTFQRAEVEGFDCAGYVTKLTFNLNRQTQDYTHKRRVMQAMMTKKGVEWDTWPEADAAHIGLKLIDLVIQATGVAEVSSILVRHNKSENYLGATENTQAWIGGKLSWDEVLCPIFQPMIVPPVDWTTPFDGGYLSPWPGASQLVKTRNKAYVEELAVTDQAMVYAGVNAIQKTAWKVETRVLKVLAEVWRHTHMVFGRLPEREDLPKPPKPPDIATNKEARKEWRRRASKIIQENLKVSSRRLMIETIVRTAEKFQGEAAIYFPHNLDFRGRIYSIPSGLCPQGHDIAKGLLTFAQGKPLGTEGGAHWLAIHGANLWGHDKVSLEDRVEWIKQQEVHIRQSVANPLDYTWWTGADGGQKAWQFLAFCHEWVGYLDEGLSFVSHLPVALDGSCNGLQHFSAMLRDPIGGAAVNLLPSDKPNDIYQTVCDRLIEKLKAEGGALALSWLIFGITRKTTKRPVMVVPYGGTRHSAKQYIFEHVAERLAVPGTANPWGDKKAIWEACNFLSGYLWEAIRETVVAARDAMDWLQKVSQVVSKEEKPLNWTAMSGFKVQQLYPNVKDRLVKTLIAGHALKLNLVEELPTLDKRRQAQGISPNFVHSLDAAALIFTVDAAVACGLESFAMIHDSYGTLAADTDTLRECLRQAFCQMYQVDVLAAFADEIQKGLPDGVQLPPLPKKGTLDINEVLRSDFFFA